MMMTHLKTWALILVGIAALFAVVHFGAGSILPSIGAAAPPDVAAAPQNPQLVGQQAPYFDLPDVGGNNVKLSDFSGTPLVIVFWSTWNEDAADEIKILDDYIAAQSPAERLIKIIAIDSQEDPSIVSSFMDRGGYQVPVAVDAQGITSGAYRVTGLPTFYFIDSGGVVRETYTGLLSQQQIGDKVENILQ